MHLIESCAETSRFSRRVFRVVINQEADLVDLDKVLEDIQQGDLIIFRLPPRLLPNFYRTVDPRLGFYVCDTNVQYDLLLTGTLPLNMDRHDRSVLRAAPSMLEQMTKVARESFSGYLSHYHHNPTLDCESILDGYVDWGCRLLSSNDCTTWFFTECDEIKGFLSARTDDTDTWEIILNGVMPKWRRKGIYGRLLGGMIAEARQAGVRRVEISTQVHNVDVQRVWQKLGFRIFDTELTIHLYKSKQAEGL